MTIEILKDLNQLLADDLSPHSISQRFEKITEMLSKENLHIEKTDCREYYEDKDLSLILLMKNDAIANGQFDQASKFRLIENELLVEKGNHEFTKLKTEPFYFEYKHNRVVFHFNKGKENQRLIANLIDRHNFIHKIEQVNKKLSW